MENTNKNQLFIKVGILLGLITAVFLVFQLTPLKISDFTPTSIKNFILGFGIIAPLVFMTIYALRGAILVIPVGIMSLAGGLAFGKWWGTVYILVGATAGSCLSFLIARYFGRGFIERFEWLHKGRVKKLDENIEKNGFRVILFMRLIPLFQYDALNFGSGLSKVKFRDYVLATFLGMAPGGFVNATLGESLENVVSIQFFIALGLFVLIMFIPAIYKKIKKKSGDNIPLDSEPANQ